jgi:hypothetical protein
MMAPYVDSKIMKFKFKVSLKFSNRMDLLPSPFTLLFSSLPYCSLLMGTDPLSLMLDRYTSMRMRGERKPVFSFLKHEISIHGVHFTFALFAFSWKVRACSCMPFLIGRGTKGHKYLKVSV